jgi:N-acetylglutamate synthase/N-acetylornithine aminotransferase
VTAAGYSGVAIRAEPLSLAIGGMRIFERGGPVAVTAIRCLGRSCGRQEVTFTLDVGTGPPSVE